MREVRPDEVNASGVRVLGFDSDYVDFDTPEVLASVVRWTAAQHCPTSPARLRKVVTDHIGPVIERDEAALASDVADMIEQLVATSDLVECQEGGTTELRLGSPRFVRVSDQDFIVLGCAPAGEGLVSESIQSAVSPDGPIRHIDPELLGATADELRDSLRSEGLVEITTVDWVRGPRECPWQEFLDQATVLAEQGLAGSGLPLTTISVFDPTSDPRFYPRRWRPPQADDDGLFVGRRPQAWGSDLWFLGLFAEGRLNKVKDLPYAGWLGRACDQAWRVLAALDASKGHPTTMRVYDQSRSRVRLEFDTPLPMFFERLILSFGSSVARSPGSLLTYSVRRPAADEIIKQWRAALWGQVGETKESS